MYNAPAVTYPVGRSHFQSGLTLAVGLAGALAQGAWWLLSDAPGPVHGLGWLLWLVFCSWALWRVLRTPQLQLVWDGQEWRLQAGASNPLVTPQVILDVQHGLLLCLRPETGRALWVWPAQQTQPERWLALRRALFNPGARPDPSRLAASPEV
jgi:toxin CptA